MDVTDTPEALAKETMGVMVSKDQIRKEIELLVLERDHRLMEDAVLLAVAAGVFGADPNFEWTELTIQ